MGTYCLGTYMRDLEELPCKSLPCESVGIQMLESFWALHWSFLGGNVVLTVQGGTYGTAALSVCTWTCAAVAPLMLRHLGCSGQRFVSLDALYVHVCVCTRGEEQAHSYSAELVEMAWSDGLGHQHGWALQKAFVSSEAVPWLRGSLSGTRRGASIPAWGKAVAIFRAEICGHWGFVSMSKGSTNNWLLPQDYELPRAQSLVFYFGFFNLKLEFPLELEFALSNIMLRGSLASVCNSAG